MDILGSKTAPKADVHRPSQALHSRVAVILPCRNEQAAIVLEARPGKGNAVRRLFAAVEGDVYVMADGHGTYSPDASRVMMQLLIAERLDMVIGTRTGTTKNQYRPMHRTGNKVFSHVFNRLFGHEIEELLSGYRAFCRRFVKTFPARLLGFEVEAELTAHAIAHRLPISQVPTPYPSRAAASESKLRTFRDGRRIMLHYFIFYKTKLPLIFFSVLAALAFALGLVLFVPMLLTYLETGLVPRVPTFMVSVVSTLFAFVFLTCGLILQANSMAACDAYRRDCLRASIKPPAAGESD